MHRRHLRYLACPECRADLRLLPGYRQERGSVQAGTLECAGCGKRFEIVRHIPRFVPVENYASGFGLEWTKHARTQYDRDSGDNVSQHRFFEETAWPRRLEDETILEVGSGSGRFTEHAAGTGAMVVSLDYSYAVEANQASNGSRENVLIVQGDVFHMPLRHAAFDRVFCFGMLQHTPDPEGAFMALPQFLKPGGSLVVDVYKKVPGVLGALRQALVTKYWVRPLTRRMSPEKLYAWCESYVHAMWPLARQIHKLPLVGKHLNWALLIADYRGVHRLSEEKLREWAVLDTFDMLAPRYDSPQYLATLESWFRAAGLTQIDVHYGFNGVVGRAIKAEDPQPG